MPRGLASVPISRSTLAIRESLIANLQRAQEIVENWPWPHKVVSDDKTLHTLVSLAVHDAYHIGQIKLMSRMIGLVQHK